MSWSVIATCIFDRLLLMKQVTSPIICWYRDRGILVSVDTMRSAQQVSRHPHRVLWPYLRTLNRPWAIAVATLIGLCFTASVPAEVYFYGTSFANSQALTHFVLSTPLLRSMQFCSSFFSWAVILEGLMAFRGALSGRADRSVWFLPAAGTLAVLSLLGTSPKLRPTAVFPSVYLS